MKESLIKNLKNSIEQSRSRFGLTAEFAGSSLYHKQYSFAHLNLQSM